MEKILLEEFNNLNFIIMKTIIKTSRSNNARKVLKTNRNLTSVIGLLALLILIFNNLDTFAHCDSYDGPVIKDAERALETNNVNLVLKWISSNQEDEVISLFNKTYSLKDGDGEIYRIVKTYFFETLVRLHRQTEGAPYTGLKPAGNTKNIIQLSDNAISTGDIDELIEKLDLHINDVLKEKYNRVFELNKIKNNSISNGRLYVEAYVDYTHTIEAIHDIITNLNNEHFEHKH